MSDSDPEDLDPGITLDYLQIKSSDKFQIDTVVGSSPRLLTHVNEEHPFPAPYRRVQTISSPTHDLSTQQLEQP
jgi:hypothetical protein